MPQDLFNVAVSPTPKELKAVLGKVLDGAAGEVLTQGFIPALRARISHFYYLCQSSQD